MTTDYSIN